VNPDLRKVALSAHVIASVGWLGAVAVFIALGLAGVTSSDAEVSRSAYIAMDVSARWVIVPLCVGSLLTGFVSSFGTPWGVFRYYWVAVKLVMAVPSTVLLFVHLRPISEMARMAAQTTLPGTEISRLRLEIVGEAGVALVVLLVATVLSVYKPSGRTGLAI
jgi:hypothetical protein